MKFKIIFVLVISSLSFGLISQENAKSFVKEDTARVSELLQLSKKNFSEAPDNAIALAEGARKLSEKIGYSTGIALALKNIGIGYYYQGKDAEALDYWKQSLEVFKSIHDEVGEANILNNIGAIYFNAGDDAHALEYYLQSLRLAEKTKDKLRILTAYNNIGGVYFNKTATHDKALQYFLKALPLSEELGDSEAIGTTSVNLGEIYYVRNDDSLALVYYNKSLKAFDNSENSPYSYNAIGKVYNRQNKYDLAISFHNKALAIAEKLNGNLDIVQSLMGLAKTNIQENNLNSAFYYLKRAEAIATEYNFSYEQKNVFESMANFYNKRGDFKNAFDYMNKFSEIKDTLYNVETDKKLGSLQFDFEMQKKQGEVDLLKKDKELQEVELKRQKFVKNAFLIGLLLVFFVALNTYRNYLGKVKTNKLLDKQKDEIETLVLNILPAKVAKELQETGKAVPRHYDMASVMFSDFKSFTVLAEEMSATDLIEHLNECFQAFDDITGKYNLEKIKTIGDCYMCAGGIPVSNDEHTVNMVKACFEMLEWVEKTNEKRRVNGLTPWEMRLGIHVGPIIAGVVGKKKYAYDIWGNTVNVASRMESSGEAGKINVSQDVYNLIKDKYVCTSRGKLMAKNVGEVDMYFVEHEILVSV